MAISRVTAIWQGFTGAPGYTNFFFDAFGGGDVVDDEVGRVVAFFEALAAALPNGVSVAVQQEVAILEETTGGLIDYAQASSAPAVVAGTGSGGYSSPTGAAITWNTETVAKGRRLRGRTFIVPLNGGRYEANGTLTSVAIDNLTAAAGILVGDGTGPQLVIWSRPENGAGGAIGPVTSYGVRDKAAILRSRRD